MWLHVCALNTLQVSSPCRKVKAFLTWGMLTVHKTCLEKKKTAVSHCQWNHQLLRQQPRMQLGRVGVWKVNTRTVTICDPSSLTPRLSTPLPEPERAQLPLTDGDFLTGFSFTFCTGAAASDPASWLNARETDRKWAGWLLLCWGSRNYSRACGGAHPACGWLLPHVWSLGKPSG